MAFSRLKRKKPLRFPDIRKSIRNADSWTPVLRTPHGDVRAYTHQGVIPADPNLAEKMGIKPGQKIIAVAGGAGDWTHALSKTCKVTYTDISPRMAKYVATEKKGELNAMHAWPAEAVIRRPNQYDWTFSFEPYPLQETSKQLDHVLVRSLLNRYGGKIVEQQHTTLDANLKRVAELYGASFESSVATIRVQPWNPDNVGVLTLHTNARARQRAWNDVRFLRLLTIMAQRDKRMTFGEIASKL
ncbi:MAG: class I SAM-dependent methyltransferase, partial [Candidatus Diapherotrites archaeon]|nr:class I SAM-dependent methyltransferase [Candidatus Diapherotrites archaeon]